MTSGAAKRRKREAREEASAGATFTAHARERMRQMDVHEDEVVSAIRYPMEVRDAHRSERPARYYIGRRISAVVGEGDVVVTVLWSDRESGNILQPDRWRRGTPA